MSSPDEQRPQELSPTDGAESHVADLSAEVERARARVAASLSSLGEKVARHSDWRAWVRERPTLVIAGALVLGFVWGGGGPPPEDQS